MALNFNGNVDEFIYESYTLLFEELEGLLSDPSELFTSMERNDIFSVLSNRLDTIQLYHNDLLTQDELEVMKVQRTELLSAVMQHFEKEFPMMEDFLQLEYSENHHQTLAYLIYKLFYMKRKDLLETFVIDKILLNRNDLVERYKGVDIRQDLAYKALRAEGGFVNTSYYTILVCYNEIIEEYLTDESLSLDEIGSFYYLTEAEYDLFETINASDNGLAFVKQLVESMRVNQNYIPQLVGIRTKLGNLLKVMA